ncbi:MAG: phosphatidate cytidylyltransferase [Candidatus Saccharibacteria bacterium]|nr:phosphatidate cytidylyltransferase [Candidatus Saccharibacteria bacterium]
MTMTLKLSLLSLAWFSCLFLAGAVACLPLYRWNWQRFFKSSIWTKIVWWWPIFLWLLAMLWLGLPFVAITVLLMAVFAVVELRRQHRLLPVAYVYFGVTVALFASLLLYWTDEGHAVWLLAVCFSSALSDVAAFFGGRYLGRHKLPKALNPNKAWEGVAGQIVGGALGWWATVSLLNLGLPWWPGILIGFASAIGDLANSYVKRRLGIADWGTSIPGHGGVLDRFSSLSVALTVGFCLMIALG